MASPAATFLLLKLPNELITAVAEQVPFCFNLVALMQTQKFMYFELLQATLIQTAMDPHKFSNPYID